MIRKDDIVMTDPLIGVSPAYVISRFGDQFTADQMAAIRKFVRAGGTLLVDAVAGDDVGAGRCRLGCQRIAW